MKHLLRTIAWSALATLAGVALLELAARALTCECANGMPRFASVPLLPFRPPREVVERVLERRENSTYIVQDRELGWTIGPLGESTVIDGEALYRSNRQGLRAPPEREYGATPPRGRTRIVTVGDSFTHCDEVNEFQTWQHDLELLRPDLEVLNLGVPGYGTDQALMRWRRDGRRFESQVVVLGIWPENICRNLSMYRYYLVPADSFACKPRMVLEGGALSVINSPVADGDEQLATLTRPESNPLLAGDFWFCEDDTRATLLRGSRIVQIAESALCVYRRREQRLRLYSQPDSAGIALTAAIAEQFSREVRAEGSTPIVLLIPMRELLDEQASGAFPLAAALRERGVEVIDLAPALRRAALAHGLDALYTATGHHTAEGNRVVAETLAEELRPWIELAQR